MANLEYDNWGLTRDKLFRNIAAQDIAKDLHPLTGQQRQDLERYTELLKFAHEHRMFLWPAPGGIDEIDDMALRDKKELEFALKLCPEGELVDRNQREHWRFLTKAGLDQPDIERPKIPPQIYRIDRIK